MDKHEMRKHLLGFKSLTSNKAKRTPAQPGDGDSPPETQTSLLDTVRESEVRSCRLRIYLSTRGRRVFVVNCATWPV
jgi:hypothetical protein